jgi:hypothetical protein
VLSVGWWWSCTAHCSLTHCILPAVQLLCVVMVMMAPDPSIGTRATAAVSNLGPGILATLLGGMVGTIAKTVGGPSSAAYTAVLCVLSVLVLAMLVVNRVGMMPPFLWALGMISCLVFGLSIITGAQRGGVMLLHFHNWLIIHGLLCKSSYLRAIARVMDNEGF